MNIAQMVAGDPYTWQKMHVGMTTAELHAFEKDLFGAIRHPSTQTMIGWQQSANQRHKMVVSEFSRRWQMVWQRVENQGLSDLMEQIFEVAA